MLIVPNTNQLKFFGSWNKKVKINPMVINPSGKYRGSSFKINRHQIWIKMQNLAGKFHLKQTYTHVQGDKEK